jgi:AcrR family transcriptional regulator
MGGALVSSATLARTGTRERILAAALELIAEKGFAATSTRELSERLGFTKAALYYHFRTKEDLLVALVEPGIQQFRDLLQRSASTTEAARRDLLDGYLAVVISNLDLTRVLSSEPAVGQIERLTRLSRPLYEELIKRLIGREPVDATDAARAHVALGGIHAALLNHAPGADIEDVRKGAFVAACGALGIEDVSLEGRSGVR